MSSSSSQLPPQDPGTQDNDVAMEFLGSQGESQPSQRVKRRRVVRRGNRDLWESYVTLDRSA